MTVFHPPPASDRPSRGALTGPFLRLFLPLAAGVVAVGVWMASSRIDDEVQKELADAANHVDIGAALFSHEFQRPMMHLASLASEAAVRAGVGQLDRGRLEAMASAFDSMMRRNREYDEVRWIDHTGQERLRFNRSQAGPVRVPDTELQNKADRYFFKAAVDLDAGQTYLSAIDLNMERGKVELPIKPTVRVVTPAVDAIGKRDGVLVINVLASGLLDVAGLRGVAGGEQISVVNARGYWLRAPDAADEWGFMFDKPSTLANRYPRLWEQVASKVRSQRLDGDGLWAWRRVQSPVPGSPDSPWYVLAHTSPEALAPFKRAVWAEAAGILFVLLALLAMLCRAVVLRRAQRNAAFIELGRASAEAESLRRHVVEVERHEAVGALLASIVNASGDVIFSTTPDGFITSWNPGAEALLGYAAEEVVGKPITLLYPPESDELTLEANPPGPGNSGRNAVRRVEMQLRHKAGYMVDVAATCSQIRDKDRRLTGHTCTARDIREDKKVAQELELHREHLEALVSQRTADLTAAKAEVEVREIFIRTITDNLPGMISYWDKALRCQFANWAYKEWFGRSPEAMRGMGIADLLGELYEPSRPHIEAAMAGTPQRFERTMVKADGAKGYLVVNYIPDRRGDEVLGLFVMVTDVTSLKEAELKLRLANDDLSAALAQAAAATAAKSAFVANMSHEIRTPMNAIVGMAYLLEKSNLPPEASRLSHRIQRAGRSLLTIINDILDFSKIESGHLEIESEPFRLDEVFDNLAALMSEAAADKDIELVIAPPPSNLDRLRGDALRLGQVLINLTNNAIKFTEHGHVAVSVAIVTEAAETVTLRFAVRDTGIGIPPDKQREIFKPFTQADVSTTRRSGGTGLGLSISQRLVTLMGGELGVRSQPGQGSEFWFTLPLARCASAEAAPAGLPPCQVLVADDSPIALEALRSAVVSLGWQPDAVCDGQTAVQHVLDQLARHGPAEVILLDWKMPGMDGLAAARAIREALKDEHWPIILMVTAHAHEAMLAESGVDAIDGLLDKPVTASSLYDAVVRIQKESGRRASTPPAPAAERLAGLRLLVVDDSEINREVAQSIFAGEGAHVETANDGLQALELLRSRPADFDIVLMDVQMPVMDGHEATQEIRRIPALARLPILAVTAGVLKTQKDAATAAGMDDFIAKPFDVDAAVALILKLTRPGAAPMLPDLPVATTPGRVVPMVREGAPTYPGIDLSRGLAVWKDAGIYRRFLGQFADDYADSVATLGSAEPAAAESLVHKLTGAAGSLRLTQVAACASELNQAFRKGQATPAMVEALQRAMETALTSIRAYAPDSEVSSTPPAAEARPPAA